MLPGGSVFVTTKRKQPPGRSATQTLLDVEAELQSSSGAPRVRSSTQKAKSSQRSQHTLRRMVHEQLERDILTEFKSQEFEINPLCDEPDMAEISEGHGSSPGSSGVRGRRGEAAARAQRGERAAAPARGQPASAAGQTVASWMAHVADGDGGGGGGDDGDDGEEEAGARGGEGEEEADMMMHGVDDLVALKRRVEQADHDHSGELDMAEFIGAVSSLWPSMTRQGLQRLFMQVDANSDGTVTCEELEP